jgi:ABC-type multidrug transport system permease subunit
MTVFAADSVTFVVGGLLYLILLVTLGVFSIRKGHWVMFIIGIFIPLFWLIGAILPPTAARTLARQQQQRLPPQ